MIQPTLFDVDDGVTNCAQGRHATLRNGPPVFHDGCVNVPRVCPLCDMIVAETSYTREEWDRRHPPPR